MKNVNIIQALRDEEYLNSLSESQRADLPENAAGALMLDDEALKALEGGTGTQDPTTPSTTCYNAPNTHCF